MGCVFLSLVFFFFFPKSLDWDLCTYWSTMPGYNRRPPTRCCTSFPPAAGTRSTDYLAPRKAWPPSAFLSSPPDLSSPLQLGPIETQVLSVNLHGVYYATAASLRHMVRNAEQLDARNDLRNAPGVILNIGSVQVCQPCEKKKRSRKYIRLADDSPLGPSPTPCAFVGRAVYERRAGICGLQGRYTGPDATGISFKSSHVFPCFTLDDWMDVWLQF